MACLRSGCAVVDGGPKGSTSFRKPARSLADRRGSVHPQGCWKTRWVKFAIKGYNSGQSRLPATTGIFSYRAMPNDNVSLESSVAISEDVVSRDLEGEAVILNLESGIYFGLDKVGTRIWSLLQEDGSLRRAFEAVQQEYDVAPEKLEGDLLRLAEELRAKGLLRVSSSEEGQPTHA